jgi:hypothetical protein
MGGALQRHGGRLTQSEDNDRRSLIEGRREEAPKGAPNERSISGIKHDTIPGPPQINETPASFRSTRMMPG